MLRIPNHGRGAIKNLVPSEGAVMVSILPTKDWVHRIGDRASDDVGKAAALPRCRASARGFDPRLAFLELLLSLGPSLWRERREEFSLVRLYHRVPLHDEVLQSCELVGFCPGFLSRVEVIDGLLELCAGPESGATDYLHTTSALAFERLLALTFTVRVYRSISCIADRKQAKDILQQQLFDTAFRFQNDGDRVAQMLVFIEVPSTAQLGLKLKDDMRATKDKLDKIAASLDSSK
jgi:hypothetical protein